MLDRDDRELAALGPWREVAESSPPPPDTCLKPSRPSKPRITRIQASSPRPALPLLTLPSSTRQPDASAVTDAYRALEDPAEAEALALRSARRREAAAALLAGVESLSPSRVGEQKKLLRLQALQNEVAIFQQHLDPFVFEIRSAREHEVRSSVYRHFARLRAVQDLGVAIYGLGELALEPTDRLLAPRTDRRVYRRVRRRDAMHFLDADLIPRPARSTARSPRSRERDACK